MELFLNCFIQLFLCKETVPKEQQNENIKEEEIEPSEVGIISVRSFKYCIIIIKENCGNEHFS